MAQTGIFERARVANSTPPPDSAQHVVCIGVVNLSLHMRVTSLCLYIMCVYVYAHVYIILIKMLMIILLISIYIYIYTYYTCRYIYIYIYRERERDQHNMYCHMFLFLDEHSGYSDLQQLVTAGVKPFNLHQHITLRIGSQLLTLVPFSEISFPKASIPKLYMKTFR